MASWGWDGGTTHSHQPGHKSSEKLLETYCRNLGLTADLCLLLKCHSKVCVVPWVCWWRTRGRSGGFNSQPTVLYCNFFGDWHALCFNHSARIFNVPEDWCLSYTGPPVRAWIRTACGCHTPLTSASFFLPHVESVFVLVVYRMNTAAPLLMYFDCGAIMFMYHEPHWFVLVSGLLTLQKLGHITLPDHGAASLGFGLQGDFITGFVNSPDLFYYKYTSGSFELMWKKSIKASFLKHLFTNVRHYREQNFNCIKYASPSGEIFLQTQGDEVWLYDQNLSLMRKLHAPGWMIGLLHGGRYAVVTNHASPGVPIKLSVVSVLNLGNIHHRVDVPPEGEYDRGNRLRACGHEESGVAVTVRYKPFVDLFNREGELYTLYPLWYDAYSSNNKSKGCLARDIYNAKSWVLFYPYFYLCMTYTVARIKDSVLYAYRYEVSIMTMRYYSERCYSMWTSTTQMVRYYICMHTVTVRTIQVNVLYVTSTTQKVSYAQYMFFYNYRMPREEDSTTWASRSSWLFLLAPSSSTTRAASHLCAQLVWGDPTNCGSTWAWLTKSSQGLCSVTDPGGGALFLGWKI